MYDANDKYPFSEISLANPHGIQGGAFFSKIQLKDDSPFLFQTPKCLTKNGIVHTDKKIYCDLVFSENNDTFINFLQELEKNIQHLIYEKRNIWFHNDMEMENIEYFFNPLIRHWKKSLLVRTYVQQPRHIKSIKAIQIYDENENRLTIKDVNKDKKVIAIIEGLGIKFTSSSFHLELCLRQLMILDDKPIFNKCLIQMSSPNHPGENETSNVLKMKYENQSIQTEKDAEELAVQPPKQAPISENVVTEETKISTTDSEKKMSEKETTTPPTSLNNSNESKIADVEDEENSDDNFENSFTFTTDGETTDEDSDTESKEVITPHEDKTPENSAEQEKDISQNKTPTSITPSNKIERTLEKKAELCEINVDLPANSESVRLKEPVEVYKEIYSKALEKAKEARRLAVQAFLEAKHIKNTFLSGEIDDSDDDFESFKEDMSG